MPTTPSPKVLSLYAEANKSDPFAARRMHLHLLNGYESSGSVAEESRRVIADRQRRIEADFRDWRKSPARRELLKRLKAKVAA